MRCSFLGSPMGRSARWALCLSSLLFLLILSFGARPVSADGIIIPEPPPERPIPWRDVPLAIKYHRVDVSISDQVATTHVDQVFVNHAAFAVEGTYIFPLPEDAAISSFDMWVDGQKLEGRVLGRDEARAIYEEIVRRERDPALLEYVGRGAFQARIFPIPPGGERRVELTYSQVLMREAGLVHYRYPLNTEKFSARPLEQVALTVHIEDKSPLRAIYSPSHQVDVVREDEHRATISYEERDVRPDRDFDLYYTLSPDAIAVNLLTYKPYDEDGFFLLLVSPPVEAVATEVVAKDVILVLDVSGSMDGEKLVQAKAAARYVLEHLGAEDRFNIVAFSSATRLFADRPVSLDRRAEALSFVERLTAQGSTDINRALLEALAGVDPARPTVLIFLTDGLPTTGEVNPDHILANVQANIARSVRLFAFGVGYDVDTFLLDQLSRENRGVSAYVQPGQKIDEEVSGFYTRISAPVLVDVRLDVEGVMVEDLYPYPLPDLFAGAQLAIVGRYRSGGRAVMRLSGSVNGQPQTYLYQDLEFVERGGQEFIPRLWAQRKIGYLLTQVRLHGAKEELVEEIVALSTRYGIITPYTSFLVQEPELALTDAGRRQLALEAVVPSTATMPGLGAAPRSGSEAVERAVIEKEMEAADQAYPATGHQEGSVKQVGDKAFVLHEGVWVDTLFDPSRMRPETIAFGSDRYFELLQQHETMGRYLALGERVIVVIDGQAFAVGPGGELPAPSPQPSPPEGGSTGEKPVSPATGGVPAGSAVACPGIAVVGLAGVALPFWARRRAG